MKKKTSKIVLWYKTYWKLRLELPRETSSKEWNESLESLKEICQKQMPAKYKFVSIEPLIGRLEKLDFKGIDWIIVGGESGSKARPMSLDWVREIKDWCNEAGVAFWFKQNSEFGGKKELPMLDGNLYKNEPYIKLQKDLLDFL